LQSVEAAVQSSGDQPDKNPVVDHVVVRNQADHVANSHSLTKVAEQDWGDEIPGLVPDPDETLAVDGLIGSVPQPPPIQADRVGPAPVLSGSRKPAAVQGGSRISSERIAPWTATTSQNRSQMLMVFMLGIGGLVLTTLAFVVFAQMFGRPKPSASRPTRAESTNPNTSPTPAEPERSMVLPGNAAALPNPGSDSVGTTSDLEALMAVAPNVVPGPNVVPSVELNDPTSRNADTANPTPRDTLDPPPALARTADQANSLPSALDRFNRIFDSAATDLIPDAGLEINDPNKPATLAELIELGELVHPKAKAPPAVEKTLGQSVSGMTIENQTLADLALMFSQLTGSGINLELESLEAIGVSAATPIRYQTDDEKTVEQVLKGALQPLGVEMVAWENGLLVITANHHAIQAKLPNHESLEGIATEQDRAAWLSLLRRALPGEAEHWMAQEGRLVWTPEANPIEKYRVAKLLARLRRALDLDTPPMFAPDRLVPGWPFHDVIAKLRQPLKSTASERRPVVQLLREATKEVQLELVVDWIGLWRHGLTPHQMDLSLLKGRNVPQVFHRFLDEYALELVVLDQQTLLLTIPEFHRLGSQVFVMPIGAGETIEGLKDKLRLVAPTDLDRRSTLMVEPIPGRSLALVRVGFPSVGQLPELLEKPDFGTLRTQ
jgi:hypothetical protein